jgi:hypothetical protein
MLTLLIDTNVLLQCRPVSDLNWLALDAEGVRVVIPVTALAEIDHAKASGNSRRAKKARDVSSMFAAALDAGAERTKIGGCENCTWEFGSGTTLWHESLDRDIKDHRIIAEALSLASSAESVAFLTADTQARLCAMRAGLRVYTPPQDWLLPPESDPRDKRLAALEARVTAMEKASPSIEVVVEGNGRAVSEIQETLEYYEEPDDQTLDELLEVLKQRHPCATPTVVDAPSHPAALLGMRRRVPTEEDFRAYREQHYPRWLERSRRTMFRFADLISRSGRVFKYAIVLENVGAVPADGLLLKYTIFGGGKLLPPDQEDRDRLFHVPDLPSAPRPPEVEITSSLGDLLNAPLPYIPDLGVGPSRAHRDPHGFYWRDVRSDLSDSHELECEEFRHGRVERLEFEILMPSTPFSKGALVCEVSARNMQPVRHTVAVSHKGVAVDPGKKLRELVSPPPTLLLRSPKKGE